MPRICLTTEPHFTLACAAILLCPLTAWGADPIPVGPPIEVNVGGDDPQVAVDPAGNFMVVWFQTGGHVRGRRYYSSGVATGPRFDVKDYEYDAGASSGSDNAQSITADAAGNFLVIFEATHYGGEDYGCYPDDCVLSRRFTSDFKIGPTFRIHDPNPSYNQSINSEVGVAGDGTFAVAWEGYDDGLGGPNGGGLPGSDEGVFGRRLVSSGQKNGNPFLVNSVSDGYQGELGQLDIAGDDAGQFTVVWSSGDYDTPTEGSITLQRFTGTGNKIGGELHVSSATDLGSDPHVASAPGGTSIVTWERDGIRARIVDPSGTALGSDMTVDPDGTENDVAASPDSFAVVWKNGSLWARLFDLDGTPASDTFLVNASGGDDPSIGMDGAGNMLVAWKEAFTIFAQRFQVAAPVDVEIPVATKTLLLTNKLPDDKEKNKGKWKAAGPEIVAPLRGSLGDPRCNGDPDGTVKAGVRFFSTTSGQDTGLLPLPCQNWRSTGGDKVSSVPKRGFKYADGKLEDGPCNSVKIVGTKSISVSCKGKGETTDFLYDLVPGTDEGTVSAVLELQGQRFCAEVIPTPATNGSDGKKLKGKNAAAPAGCPGPLLPTPTPLPTPSPTPALTPTPTPTPGGSASLAFVERRRSLVD